MHATKFRQNAIRRFFQPALVFIAASLIFASTPAFAQEKTTVPLLLDTSDPAACWRGAAGYHKVDMWLLYSIAWVESRMNPTAINRNKNGSVDIGMMQINTIWLPELARYGITQHHLLDGCTSIYIGAWILSKNIRNHGYTWKAIGAYNSATPGIGFRYAQKVYEAHKRLTGLPTPYAGTKIAGGPEYFTNARQSLP